MRRPNPTVTLELTLEQAQVLYQVTAATVAFNEPLRDMFPDTREQGLATDALILLCLAVDRARTR